MDERRCRECDSKTKLARSRGKNRVYVCINCHTEETVLPFRAADDATHTPTDTPMTQHRRSF